MDWKEQLAAVVRESGIQQLDVRFICVRHQGQWILRRFRATLFHADPAVPEQVRYPVYLFLRKNMSATDFLQLIDELTAEKKGAPQAQEPAAEEQTAQVAQEQLHDAQPPAAAEKEQRAFSVNGQDICYDSVALNFQNHIRSNTLWGLAERPLPTWNFGGMIWPDIPEGQEPLVAAGAPYFPTPLEGQAWYLYEKALQPPNNYIPNAEISLEDERAFFRDVVIDEKASTVVCQCAGTKLEQATLRLYTDAAQIEQQPARSEVTFHLRGEPKSIALALTSNDSWLDRRDTNLNYLQLGVPRGVKVTGRSLRSVTAAASDTAPAIAAIAGSDPSDLAAVAGPHLILADRFYVNVLEQSRQSFRWAMGGFVGVFGFVAAAILLLLLHPIGDASDLAAIITALGSVPSGFLAAYLLNLHKHASDQAAASQVILDRIQRFFIAINVSAHLNEESRDETRVALIKKLNDL